MHNSKNNGISYAWIITKDFITDPSHDTDDAGTHGPSQVQLTEEQIKNHPDARQFRMYDSENILTYEGLFVGGNGNEMYGPLEDFGEANAGCTSIHYQSPSGEWTQR